MEESAETTAASLAKELGTVDAIDCDEDDSTEDSRSERFLEPKLKKPLFFFLGGVEVAEGAREMGRRSFATLFDELVMLDDEAPEGVVNVEKRGVNVPVPPSSSNASCVWRVRDESMDIVERRLSLRLSNPRRPLRSEAGRGREGEGVGDETTS